MKFSLTWLKDYLETTATVSEICDALNAIGPERAWPLKDAFVRGRRAPGGNSTDRPQRPFRRVRTSFPLAKGNSRHGG